jgi:hypothetical protein
LILGGCVLLAALSLLTSARLSYDPWSWMVFTREIVSPHATLVTTGPTGWKPLPVLIAAPFSLTGPALPYIWLFVARLGALLALVGAYRLAARIAGPTAGVLAAIFLLVLHHWVTFAAGGATDPLVAGAVVWAVERHLAGRPRQAFALIALASLGRPELWLGALLYALLVMRREGRPDWRLGAALIAVPLLWAAGDWAGSGDPFAGAQHASASVQVRRLDASHHPAWTLLRQAFAFVIPAAVALSAAAILLWLRRRDPGVSAILATAGVLGVPLIVATELGYPGLPRFLLPTAALMCVLAGVAAVRLAALVPGRLGLVALAAVSVAALAVSFGPASDAYKEAQNANNRGRVTIALAHSVAHIGRHTALRCGEPRVEPAYEESALAWFLDVATPRTAGRDVKPPLLVFITKQKLAAGGLASFLRHGRRAWPLPATVPWRAFSVTAARAGSQPPAGCPVLAGAPMRG